MKTLELTQDGSPTIYIGELDEHYHSVKGAVTESMHVYIACGLRRRIDEAVAECAGCMRVLEFGFGTGLNAALTMIEADRSGVPLAYDSLELYPLEESMAEAFGASMPADIERALSVVNGAEWNSVQRLTENFSLHKIKTDFLSAELGEDVFDVVYFDAFAPEKQAELWTSELFGRIYSAMRSGGVMTTYCAKGCVRRLLEGIGFTVERLAGPPGGKREILRAVKP